MTSPPISSKFKTAALALGICLGLSQTACSRDHIEAINLANEADKQVSVDTAGAIQKYEAAIQLDPTNHLIIDKLSKAYEKKEDWDKMASTLSKAVGVAPGFANYWERRGMALTKLAEGGNPDAWKEAQRSEEHTSEL